MESELEPKLEPFPPFINRKSKFNSAFHRVTLNRSSGSLRRSVIGSLRSRSSRSSRKESPIPGKETPTSRPSLRLRRIEEVHRPELEQDVDLYIDDGVEINKLQTFEENLRSDITIFPDRVSPRLHLLRLPAVARLKIYDYCLPESSR